MGVTTYSPKLERLKARRNSGQSISTGTDTTINWHTSDYITSGFEFDSPSVINILRNGIYMVVINADFSASTGGTYRQTRMYGNTAGVLNSEIVVSGVSPDFRTIFQSSWIGELGPNALDDQIYFTAIHTAGVSLTLNGTDSTWVAIQMLRPL